MMCDGYGILFIPKVASHDAFSKDLGIHSRVQFKADHRNTSISTARNVARTGQYGFCVNISNPVLFKPEALNPYATQPTHTHTDR